MKLSRRKFIKLGLCTGVGALVASYPFCIERYYFQVNTYQIPVPNLPAEFNGFSIAQITDLHFGFLMPLSIIKHLIKKANDIPKDMIVCTGDYIHERNSSNQIDLVWPLLMRLKAKYGVYSVLGNHDHLGDTDRSLYWLKKSGQSLRHRSVSINNGSSHFWIGGAGDFWEDEIGIDKAFEGVPRQDCKILLAHNPDSIDTNYETRLDLTIAGHTHGGQVNIPFLGTPVLPVINKAYSSGLIRTKNKNIYISRGLGWAIIPVRFNCFPEISVLKLILDT